MIKENKSIKILIPLLLLCVIIAMISLGSCNRSRSSNNRSVARESQRREQVRREPTQRGTSNSGRETTQRRNTDSRRESSQRSSSARVELPSNLRISGISDQRLKEIYSVFIDTINYWQYDETVYLFNYTPQQRISSGRGVCWDYALYFYKESQRRGLNEVHFVVSTQLKHAWNEVWINNTVYIIEATWADTDPYLSIDTFFMIDASLSEDHFANDICVVDDTMDENDIATLYRGVLAQDSKRQRYTAARPIVKLRH